MPADPTAWYRIDDINKIDSPALVIYSDRVKHNIALAIQMVGNVSRLRPHVKTHKSPQATELLLRAGITKFKCATVAEAEMLAQCKAPDVLLAYQPTGPKINRWLTLIQRFPDTQFSCLVDSVDAAQAMAVETLARGLTINVLIDVNIGMNRTGIIAQNALYLYEACVKLNALRIIGLHGYDGHINDTDLEIRKQRTDEAFRKLADVQKQMKSAGFIQPLVIVGGTPTFPIHARRNDVECSPGTFVYWDKGYSDLFPDLHFLPAALVVSRVVSIVNKKTICIDLGHKSIAAENPLGRRIHWLNATDLTPISHSEEHMVLETFNDHSYRIGDVLYGMPYHVCPTVALYDTAFVIEEHRVKELWQTIARDRKIYV